MDYLPSIKQITREIIATGVAVVVVAFVVSKSPALKKLVKDYQT
jgi:hypothetical protein